MPLAALNDAPRLSSQVKHHKLKWLYKYFEAAFPAVSSSEEYRTFCSQNPWLFHYALFKALKDEYGGKHWEDWPYDRQSPEKCTADPKAINFHRFLQFHAYRQLEKAKAHATSRGVFFKGDLPILLSPDSADVWANRSLFDLSDSAGAPPDYYNPLGQKWGFPLIRWDEMRKANFGWWKERLRMASRLFHIYRLDHVIGFFRIWAIHSDELPAEGHFVPADPNLWGMQGREILEMMIQTSPLLPMAEDLGAMIPEIVHETLHELGICGTKVMRWAKNGDSYLPFQEYDPLSLTTVSTCDSETLDEWWETLPEEAARYAAFKHWAYEPKLSREHHLALLYDSHHTASLFHINLLQEYLALFSRACLAASRRRADQHSGDASADELDLPLQAVSRNNRLASRSGPRHERSHPNVIQKSRICQGYRPDGDQKFAARSSLALTRKAVAG